MHLIRTSSTPPGPTTPSPRGRRSGTTSRPWSTRQSGHRMALVHGHVVRVDGPADHAGLGDARHPDLPGRLLLRRPLGHVLRRLGQPQSGRQRAQLPLGGDGRVADPVLPGVHRLLGRPTLLRSRQAGVLDPSPFVDPATGTAYLLWKSNDGSSAVASQVWSGPAQRQRHRPRRVTHRPAHRGPGALCPGRPPSTTPRWSSPPVATSCSSRPGTSSRPPTRRPSPRCSGPSDRAANRPAAPSSPRTGAWPGPAAGRCSPTPAGSWWLGFAGWTAGCTNYGCGGARRLFTAPIDLSNGLNVPCNPPAGGPAGYRITASDGGIFSFGNLPFCGSTGCDLHQPAGGGHGRHRPTAAGTGPSPGTAGSSPSATAASAAPRADPISTSPSWAWRPPRTARATGWWPVRRRHLLLRGRLLLRLDRGHAPQPAHRGHGRHPRRPRLLAGGLRRRHLHLR